MKVTGIIITTNLESKAYIDYRAFADSVLYIILWSALYFFLFGKISLNKVCELKEIITIDIFFFITPTCRKFRIYWVGQKVLSSFPVSQEKPK